LGTIGGKKSSSGKPLYVLNSFIGEQADLRRKKCIYSLMPVVCGKVSVTV
jgi:hypothetical protein